MATIIALRAVGVEPWADSHLRVSEGLEVWIDASAQNAARQAHGLPQLAVGRPVDIWFDGSGGQHDLEQRLPGARPKFVVATGGAYVRFDGKDDFLAASNLRRAFTNATIFVVAAPRSNLGGFRGFLGLNQAGRNDYQSGVNFDLGAGPSPAMNLLNAEGAGFEGMRNLVTNSISFGGFHMLTLVCGNGEAGVRVFVDGSAHGKRERKASLIHMDELTVGARCYSNTPEPPHTQGHLDGDIAEVLIFSRALADQERSTIERYLAEKHKGLRSQTEERVTDGLRPLETVANPPPVQMFVPGFSVRTLPLSLNNINNLKYRPDGKLVALGYDGRIYLLSDSDSDGLEDKADVFWDAETLRAPIGMALTPPAYARGEGVFVASKGKLSLIVDRDHDGRADQEIVVATGWKELFHGVDALGVALDHEDNIYFGLGCANFTDAYLIDKASGKSRYDLKSERGTILKVSPDFSRREILCTGIRFPVALAFNREGDLFCTDQEGATWLSNGNPFDELLHIEPGRHYGFPPRHPKHLPNVIDEPSVFDYAPQHQSTCGLNFNESLNGGATFGPTWWAGDAIVSGYSRAKLYRTKLVKTASGYVGQNNLIACLNVLTVDACVSPTGDLVVATHSGPPDWGTGPQGKGKLYKISYVDHDVPQPLFTCAPNPGELRVTFDRPLDPASLTNLTKRISITRGKYVAAGDRFESLRPGYQAVQDQLVAPRYDVPVLSALLTSDRRSLLLLTPQLSAAENYAVTLPRFNDATVQRSKGTLPQNPTIELATDLTGVEARWVSGAKNKEEWSGWLPHLDLDVARALTKGSADHDRFWALLEKPGKLILRAQLNLWQMLQPAVQPGSMLDYKPPPEEVNVELSANVPMVVNGAGEHLGSSKGEPLLIASLSHQPRENQWLPMELTLTTSNVAPKLAVSWHTKEDPRQRAFPLRRFLVPWTTPSISGSSNSTERVVPEIAGGNWLHGKRLFFGDQLACFKCHAIRGEGGKVGPDLSNLIFRDYASVLNDIASPNATINPEHLAYNIELKNGDAFAGVLQSDKTNELIVGLVSGESRRISKTELASLKPAAVSLMPEGLTAQLAPQQLKDLMTFLLTSPLDPAPLETTGEPPPRSRKQIEPILSGGRDGALGRSIRQDAERTAQRAVPAKRLRIVLAAGPKDHGPGEHDYPLWQKRWEKLLRLADDVEVSTAFGWPKAEQFQNADVIVFYSDNPGWSAEGGRELDAFLKRGGGLVYLHYAVDGHQNVPELAQRIGLAWKGGASKFRHGPLDLHLHPHAVTAGWVDEAGHSAAHLNLIDESYWQLIGDEKNVQLVATGMEEGGPRPLIWTREQGAGRVFVSIPGHYTWTFDDPLFRMLLLRGICWTAHQPLDRLSELGTIGARIAE